VSKEFCARSDKADPDAVSCFHQWPILFVVVQGKASGYASLLCSLAFRELQEKAQIYHRQYFCILKSV